MALSEWLLPHCETCRGAKEMIAGPKRIICPTCEGYGVKRYSDRERQLFLGFKFKPFAKKYARIVAMLTAHEKGVNPVMNEQLEKTA